MTNWSFFKPKVRSIHDCGWMKLKSEFLSSRSMETLHGLYCCDLNLEQCAYALDKLEKYFCIPPELRDLFRRFFSFLETEINFDVYVFYLWNICTLHQSDFASFIFGLYTTKGSDTICRDHVLEVLRKYQKRSVENSKYSTLPNISYSTLTFALFCKENSDILTPIFNLQTIIRDKVLGQEFWVRKMKKRFLKRQTDNYVVTVGHLKMPVTIQEMFNYFYKLKIRTIPLHSVAKNFFSSHNCGDIIRKHELEAFKLNPFLCLLMISHHNHFTVECSNCSTGCFCSTILEQRFYDDDCSHDGDVPNMVAFDRLNFARFCELKQGTDRQGKMLPRRSVINLNSKSFLLKEIDSTHRNVNSDCNGALPRERSRPKTKDATEETPSSHVDMTTCNSKQRKNRKFRKQILQKLPGKCRDSRISP